MGIGRKLMGGMSDQQKSLPVYLTPAEVADMLHLKEKTLEKWRMEERGPRFIRMGKGGRARVVYDVTDVTAWMNSQKSAF